MQTSLSPEFKGTPDGEAAEAILRKCVHCGFCTATCPTYQLLGDELDGPRGRIYLIKQVVEGSEPTRATQVRLDRCLTCRNCETTCPSGVRYGELVEIGRRIVDAKVQRPLGERIVRSALRSGLTSPLFGPAAQLGQALRPLVPAALRDKLPPPAAAPRRRTAPLRTHARKMLVPAGCVQPSLMPNIDAATIRVLDACGIQAVSATGGGCCGAIRAHLDDHAGGLADMRRNIDAWLPLLEAGTVEAIVVNASGCSLMVKEYGHALAHDPAYADKARRISDATRDLSELLPMLRPLLAPLLQEGNDTVPRRVVFHPPCTLQHGQRVRGVVETELAELGFEVTLAAGESHLCCGSAGTYSLLQPELSKQLRNRKLGQLQLGKPQAIISANIGCIQQLQSGTTTPVRHWIELLDEALP